MKTKLYDEVSVCGSNFILSISQNELITKVTINKHDIDGHASDQKIFCFTNEEFEMFIKCLKYNDENGLVQI